MGGQGGNLELDLNFMLRVPLWPIVRADSKALGSYKASGIPILDVHELAAGQLAALFARHASRDLFDVHQLLNQYPFDHAKLRIAFVVYGAMNRNDWRTISTGDLKCKAPELRDLLLPLPRGGQLADSSGREVRMERLVAECVDALSIVVPFTEREEKFLNSLLQDGRIEPEILTDDTALSERIRTHPGLQWKAAKVRRRAKE